MWPWTGPIALRWAIVGSDLGLAAVDEELGAGDEARVVRSQEDRGLGDLVGVADAAERDVLGHLVQQLLLPRGVGASQADQAGGPRGAGAEDVHADATA